VTVGFGSGGEARESAKEKQVLLRERGSRGILRREGGRKLLHREGRSRAVLDLDIWDRDVLERVGGCRVVLSGASREGKDHSWQLVDCTGICGDKVLRGEGQSQAAFYRNIWSQAVLHGAGWSPAILYGDSRRQRGRAQHVLNCANGRSLWSGKGSQHLLEARKGRVVLRHINSQQLFHVEVGEVGLRMHVGLVEDGGVGFPGS
jgi:hypothetical protein